MPPVNARNGSPPKVREACGVVGVWDVERAAERVRAGLQALQHRGQDAAGIATFEAGRAALIRGAGRVEQALPLPFGASLHGRHALGHVRYRTSGPLGQLGTQPLLHEGRDSFLLAHNGHLPFLDPTAAETDSAWLLRRIAESAGPTLLDRTAAALEGVDGAFSLALLDARALVAVRDPWGFRPLCIGRAGRGWVVASESVALEAMGAALVRHVEPGECISLDDGGLRALSPFTPKTPARCLFEWVYVASPASDLEGAQVAQVRRGFGEALAREAPAAVDGVVALPGSGLLAAEGFATALGLPLLPALTRTQAEGRAFLEPDDARRQALAAAKFTLDPAVVAGRRLAVVDDSLVRGHTAAVWMKALRAAGAREVHLRIASPRVVEPCHFGIDLPEPAALVARKGDGWLLEALGLDSLAFLSLPATHEVVSRSGGPGGRCDRCYAGRLPDGLKLGRRHDP